MALLNQKKKGWLKKSLAFVEQHKVSSAAIASGFIVAGIFGQGITHAFGVGMPVPWGDLAIATPLLGLGLTVILYLAIAAATGASPDARRRIDVVFKVTTPIAVLAYFSYQVAAGAYFATTSVHLEPEKGTGGREAIVLKVTLERGDNWLARIQSVSYATSEIVPMPRGTHYTEILFPARDEGLGSSEDAFSLAPKETSSTMIEVPFVGNKMYVTVRAISYATWWPIPGRSYTRILVERPVENPKQESKETYESVQNPLNPASPKRKSNAIRSAVPDHKP